MSGANNISRRKTKFRAFALNSLELDARASSSYSDFYIMLIGIIQGLATAYLVLKGIETGIFDGLAVDANIQKVTSENIFLAFRFVISFTAILIVSHEFMMAILMYRRYPNYWDIMLTMLLGISEVLSIHFIYNANAWWFWNGSFLLAATLIYTLTWNARKLNLRPGSRAWKRSGRYLATTQILAASASFVCFLAFFQASVFTVNIFIPIAHYAAYLFFGLIIILRGATFLGAFRQDLVDDEEEMQTD